MPRFEDIAALPFVHGIQGHFNRIRLVPEVRRRKTVLYLRLSNMLTKKVYPAPDPDSFHVDSYAFASSVDKRVRKLRLEPE